MDSLANSLPFANRKRQAERQRALNARVGQVCYLHQPDLPRFLRQHGALRVVAFSAQFAVDMLLVRPVGGGPEEWKPARELVFAEGR